MALLRNVLAVRVFPIFVLLAIAQTSWAEAQPPGCNIFVYAVDEKGNVGSQSIITPQDVEAVDLQGPSPVKGFKNWHITLTAEGASRNASFTKAHVGKQIAVFCDKKEVSRATIVGPSSNQFVVILPDNSP